jgi:hypothetical protein
VTRRRIVSPFSCAAGRVLQSSGASSASVATPEEVNALRGSLGSEYSLDMSIRWILGLRGILCIGAFLAFAPAQAQVYTCTAADGTRIFSDERCGPDAKLVPGFETKRAPARSATPRPARSQKSAEELAELNQQCAAGQSKACTEWSLGGGPNLLREQEKRAEQSCEGGSLIACEQRYCRDGIDAECRARVLATAKVAGESWYLREQRTLADGATHYDIRCLTQGANAGRDVGLTCTGRGWLPLSRWERVRSAGEGHSCPNRLLVSAQAAAPSGAAAIASACRSSGRALARVDAGCAHSAVRRRPRR